MSQPGRTIDQNGAMGIREAAALARRNWYWLVAVPVLFTAAVIFAYTRIPSIDSVIAVLNIEEPAASRAIEEAKGNWESVRLSFEVVSDQSGVLTASSSDVNAARSAVDAVIASFPAEVTYEKTLSAQNALELRALKVYQATLESDAAPEGDEVLQNLHAGEIDAVDQRINALESQVGQSLTVPVVGKGPSVVSSKMPSLKNVAIFCALASLSIVWMAIYFISSRRRTTSPKAERPNAAR